MVKGCDISHWNAPSDLIQRIRTEGLRFIMIKASEGVNSRDPKTDYFNKICELNDLAVGFYHYARPENGNSPFEEAYNFVSSVEAVTGKISELNDGILLALDWEGEALKCNVEWAIEWCSAVEQLTGITPGIYTGYSYVHDSRAFERVTDRIVQHDFWLWIARWNNTPMKDVKYVEPWPFAAMHQYSNGQGKFDYDMFNGDMETLRKYGRSKKSGEKEDEHCPCKCGCCEVENGVPTN